MFFYFEELFGTYLTCLFVRHFETIVCILAVGNEPDPYAVPWGSYCAWLILYAAESYDRICLACVIKKHKVLVLFRAKFLKIKAHFFPLRYLNFPCTVLIIGIVVWEVGGLEWSGRAVKNTTAVWSWEGKIKKGRFILYWCVYLCYRKW